MQIGHTRDDAALSEGKGSKNPSGRWTDGFAEGRCGRGRGELGYPVAVARARGPLDREWGLFSKKDLPAETEALPPCAFRCQGLQPAGCITNAIHRTCFAVMHACGQIRGIRLAQR